MELATMCEWSVYVLHNKDIPMYVGMSDCFLRRIGEHAADRTFPRQALREWVVYWKRVGGLEEAREIERALIRELKPVWNVVFNGKKGHPMLRYRGSKKQRREFIESRITPVLPTPPPDVELPLAVEFEYQSSFDVLVGILEGLEK